MSSWRRHIWDALNESDYLPFIRLDSENSFGVEYFVSCAPPVWDLDINVNQLTSDTEEVRAFEQDDQEDNAFAGGPV